MNLAFNRSRYYLKFNLDRDPFPLKSSPDNLFFTPELKQLMDRLIAAIKSQHEILIIESTPGGGKSVLAEYLNYAREDNWYLSLIHANEKIDKTEFAHSVISQHFPRHRFDRTHSRVILEEFLQLYQRNGKLPVLVIDDAHLLSQDTFAFILKLSNLRHEGAQFRIVLFADKSISTQLDIAAGKIEDTLAREHTRIPSLTRLQTAEFLNHQIDQCGTNNISAFDEAALDHIFDNSMGVPADINLNARKHMRELSTPGRARRIIYRSAACFGGLFLFSVIANIVMLASDRDEATVAPVSISLELPDRDSMGISVAEQIQPPIMRQVKAQTKQIRHKAILSVNASPSDPKQNNKKVLLADMQRQDLLRARKTVLEKEKNEMRLQLAIYDTLALRISDVVHN